MANEFPLVLRSDDNKESPRLLIQEGWYDTLMPIYNAMRVSMGFVAIEQVPVNFEKARELINALTIEFGDLGWVFSLSILTVLQWAVTQSFAVGKFVYNYTSTYKTRDGAYVISDGAYVLESHQKVKEIHEW